MSIDQPAQSAEAVARRVSQILGTVLGRTPLGPDDDFFELGGDSLAAIEAAAAIEEELGYELSIEDIFTVSGTADLSMLVWKGLRADSDPGKGQRWHDRARGADGTGATGDVAR